METEFKSRFLSADFLFGFCRSVVGIEEREGRRTTAAFEAAVAGGSGAGAAFGAFLRIRSVILVRLSIDGLLLLPTKLDCDGARFSAAAAAAVDKLELVLAER